MSEANARDQSKATFFVFLQCFIYVQYEINIFFSVLGNLLCFCDVDGTCAASAKCESDLCVVAREGACLGCKCPVGNCGELTFECLRISASVNSELVCTPQRQTPPTTSAPSASLPVAALVGGLVAAVVCLVLIAVGVWFVSRTRRQVMADAAEQQKAMIDSDSVNSVLDDGGNAARRRKNKQLESDDESCSDGGNGGNNNNDNNNKNSEREGHYSDIARFSKSTSTHDEKRRKNEHYVDISEVALDDPISTRE